MLYLQYIFWKEKNCVSEIKQKYKVYYLFFFLKQTAEYQTHWDPIFRLVSLMKSLPPQNEIDFQCFTILNM